MATKVTREDIDIIINFLKNNKEPIEIMDIYKNTNLKLRVIKAALNIIKEEYTIVISRSKSFGNPYTYSLKEERTACKLYEENKFSFISIRHYRTGQQLYLCDNKEDYTKFMCDHFLISEDEEYFYNMKGQITLIFYVS